MFIRHRAPGIGGASLQHHVRYWQGPSLAWEALPSAYSRRAGARPVVGTGQEPRAHYISHRAHLILMPCKPHGLQNPSIIQVKPPLAVISPHG